MDLATGARETFVMMSLFTRDGEPKLVPTCTCPLTGIRCVTRVYTDHGVFLVQRDGTVAVFDLYGATLRELQDRLDVPLTPVATSGVSDAPQGALG